MSKQAILHWASDVSVDELPAIDPRLVFMWFDAFRKSNRKTFMNCFQHDETEHKCNLATRSQTIVYDYTSKCDQRLRRESTQHVQQLEEVHYVSAEMVPFY